MRGVNYPALLLRSYESVVFHAASGCLRPESRLEYLSENIFNFTTYDSDVSRLFAAKAVEVVKSITTGETYTYLRESEINYTWYLLLCNTDFFRRIQWGSSIRGAWWDGDQTFESLGLYRPDGSQMHEELVFNRAEWEKFMIAIVAFAADEIKAGAPWGALA